MSAKKMLWIDLEMTGLDERAHQIVEVAALVTDWQLEVLDQFSRVIFQPPEVLSKMDVHVRELHEKSGLMPLIPNGEPLAQVEGALLQWLDQHFTKSERLILAGNSVSNDLRFLLHHFTKLASRLHYRVIDVSSFKEVFRSKYGIHYVKKGTHRALEDIHESVGELKHYLSFVHAPNQAPA